MGKTVSNTQYKVLEIYGFNTAENRRKEGYNELQYFILDKAVCRHCTKISLAIFELHWKEYKI